MFVSPGLHNNERKTIAPVIIASSILFYCGILFALQIICPVALRFFTSCAPHGVTVMLDIASYMDFIVTIAIATGIAFQIPVVTNVLIRTGIVTKQQLASKRRHVIVLAFVLGMLLAPPDVFSQVLLAVVSGTAAFQGSHRQRSKQIPACPGDSGRKNRHVAQIAILSPPCCGRS